MCSQLKGWLELGVRGRLRVNLLKGFFILIHDLNDDVASNEIKMHRSND